MMKNKIIQSQLVKSKPIDGFMNKKQNIKQSPRTFGIADWSVDVASDRIYQADNEVKLERKVMALLVHLANHPGELMTREQLEQAIWTDTVVGYDALTSSITKLRKALGDNSRKPRYIETVPKKGYRLIAPIMMKELSTTSSTAAPPTPHPSRRRWTGLILTSLIIAVFITGSLLLSPPTPINTTNINFDKPSIVILPFKELNQDPEQNYFSEGITADITTALSKHSGLFVIAWSSALSYKNQNFNIQQISESLGVRYVLKGSVRRAAAKLRVNVQLIDSQTARHLWAERYDREIKDILEVQDDIATQITQALSITLTEEEKRRTAHQYTTSIKAYDDFLRGQAVFNRKSLEATLQARELFQRAIDRDPNFARAYGAMALSYVEEFRFQWGVHSNHALEQALSLAEQAVSLDNQLSQAFWVLGYVHLHRHEYQQSTEAINQAIKIDPNNADNYALLALNQVYNDHPESAIDLIRKAMLLNPYYSAHYPSVVGQAYYFLGQYQQAEKSLHKAMERNANLLAPLVFLTATLNHQGKSEEADWAAIQVRLLTPEFSAKDVIEMFPFKQQEMQNMLINDLRQAGF